MATATTNRRGAKRAAVVRADEHQSQQVEKNTEPLSFRHKPSVVEFYKELANAERRDFYDVIRLALEDQMKALKEKATEVHPTVFAKAS
jgi:hypothetical protein